VSDGTEPFQELRLEGVGRRFGGQNALQDLDLTIRAGEFIALLGPSGCGKSTALNCLAGLLPLTAGSIWQDGSRIDTVPPEKRGFGMVFQNYALFPHMSVRGNIAFGLQMRRLGKAEITRRTTEAIRLVQLEEHAKKLPGQLSGGQQQRVAIARAVVLEPSVVLMDEPLSNLDAKLRAEMRTEIRRLHQSLGLTTVYVTHDQEEALSMADRLVVLRAGRAQQIGTPEELHTSPVSWQVADFMGFRNLLPMRVAGTGSGGVVTVEGNGLTLIGAAMAELSLGDPVVAGVRPEDVAVTGEPATGGPGNSVRGSVEVVEYQGRELAVQASIGALRLHLRTMRRVAPGDRIELSIPTDKLLVFPQGDQPPPTAQPLLATDAGPRDEEMLAPAAGKSL